MNELINQVFLLEWLTRRLKFQNFSWSSKSGHSVHISFSGQCIIEPTTYLSTSNAIAKAERFLELLQMHCNVSLSYSELLTEPHKSTTYFRQALIFE